MISPHTSAVGPQPTCITITNQIMWMPDPMLMRDIGTGITTNAIIIQIMNAPAPLRSIVDYYERHSAAEDHYTMPWEQDGWGKTSTIL